MVVGCPLALLRGSSSSSSSDSSLASSSNNNSSSSSSSHPPPPPLFNPWLELLRHVAGRGAFLGCGSDALEGAIRSSGGVGGGRPRLSAAAGKGEEEEEGQGLRDNRNNGDIGDGEGDDPELLDELSAAAVRVAELALLGSGRARELFPESLDDLEESFGGSGGGGGGTRLAL